MAAGKLLKASAILALLLTVDVTLGKKDGSFYERLMKKSSAAPAGKNGQNYVFQTPPGMHGHGHGGFTGYGGLGGFGGYGGYGGFGGVGGYGNVGRIHPVPVTGVKALSVAYDPVSGVPYVCDPSKKEKAAGAASPAGAATPAGAAAPATGKRSNTGQKDEIKVKVPDYPPCPDPKKSFPWSCLLGDKNSAKRECVRAAKAVAEASKRMWPLYGGVYGGYGGLGGFGGFGGHGGFGGYGGQMGYPIPWGGSYGFGPYFG